MDPEAVQRVRVLERLLLRPGPCTAEAVAQDTGLAVGSVHAAVEALREAGCSFLDEPHRGLRLVATGLGCWVDYIEQRHADALGRRLVAYRTTTSTQDVARTLVTGKPSSDPGGTVVTSDHQTEGRGRLGRRWFDAPGSSLAFTAVVDRRGAGADRLCLAACCAVADAIESTTGLKPAIRWPNDLLLDRRKLAGMLVEVVGDHALIGVGVNVGPLDGSLPDDDAGRRIDATSLADHGATIDRLALLDAALTHLHETLAGADDGALRRRWRDRCDLVNQRVTVDAGGSRLTGRVVDIDAEQGLVLEVERGPVVALPAATTSLVLD